MTGEPGHAERFGRALEARAVAVQAPRRVELVADRGQEELGVGAVEAGADEVGALAGVDLRQRLARQPDLAPDFCRPQPGHQPGDDTEQGRLAAPGPAADAGHRARLEAQLEAVEDRPRLAGQAHREAFDFEQVAVDIRSAGRPGHR